MSVATTAGVLDAPTAPTEDTSLVTYCRSLFTHARAIRRPRLARWNRNYRILRNSTWAPERAEWMPSPEVPEIYPIISSISGWMTDTRPSFDIIPQAQPHTPFYETLSKVADDLRTTVESTWRVHNFDSEIATVVFDGFVYEAGFLKAVWDTSLDGGLGNAVLRRIDPYNLYIDPNATNMQNANYVIEARDVTMHDLDRMFPGARNKVKQFTYDDNDRRPDHNSPYGEALAVAGPISPSTSSDYSLPGASKRIHTDDEQKVTLLECWLREHEHIKRNDTAFTYDSWRVVMVVGNVILLNETAESLYGRCEHPYDRFVPHDLGELYAVSLVDLLAPTQLMLNRVLASIAHNIDLVGDPVFYETSRAGISRTLMTNKPGQRLLKNEGGEIGWLPPPPLHEAMFPIIQFYVQEMERISGLSAINRGFMPNGRNSSQVMDSVQESAFVRIRLAQRELGRTIRSATEKIAGLVTENYTTPRFVDIVGPDGEQSAQFLKGRHFYTNLQSQAASPYPLRFSVSVESGSSLPTSRQQRIELAQMLYALGAIDRMALLEAIGYPNRTAIVARIAEQEALGMQVGPGARQRAHGGK